MPRSDSERLEDALAAAQAAVSFAGALTLDELRADHLTLAALKYELLVLGEAVGGLSDSVRQSAPDLPWSQLRGLRNVETHEYFRVSPSILHQVVTVDLPALIPRLDVLLDERQRYA